MKFYQTKTHVDVRHGRRYSGRFIYIYMCQVVISNIFFIYMQQLKLPGSRNKLKITVIHFY